MLLKYDIVILADRRFLHPKKGDWYTDEVLLEDKLVSEALIAKGLKVTRVAWDDVEFDWASTRFALFRAVWDYFDRYTAFSAWYERTSKQTTFINSKNLIDWNIDKHYMLDLNKNGVHIPKTLFIEPGEDIHLNEAIAKARANLTFSTDEFVLKPCIAGGAWHTYKFHESQWKEHNTTFRELISKEAMMLQEFQRNIVTQGEVSVMLMGGQFTHAVLKRAKKGDFRVQNDFGGSVELYKASTEEIEFALAVIKAAPELPHYARVDIFRDNDHKIALAELEIFEPELWFRLHPIAAEILAENIKKSFFP